MGLKNVVDWLSLDVRPGGPLKWLALSPHVLGRVPHLLWVVSTAEHHAAKANVSAWAEARGFNAWDLACVIACLEITQKKNQYLCAPRCPPVRSQVHCGPQLRETGEPVLRAQPGFKGAGQGRPCGAGHYH